MGRLCPKVWYLNFTLVPLLVGHASLSKSRPIEKTIPENNLLAITVQEISIRYFAKDSLK